MDTLNYLKSVKDGQLHFADGSIQNIPHWGDAQWTHFFCVRHAEKASDDPYDPELNALGDARAEHLGRIMAEAGLDAVYATPTRRTQLTAEPVCRRGFTPAVQIYEPTEQDEWLLELLPTVLGKKLLIVGHQHNIPHLLNQLVGSGFAYEHISNYDYGRFFVAATKGIGQTEVLELRY
jgi:phosphohistidine phosphatase SixA